MESIATSFSRKTCGVFDKCCGALDGFSPVLQRPSLKHCPGRNHLYSRKGYYTINVQAISDGDRRFRSFDIRCMGNTHDSLLPLSLILISKQLSVEVSAPSSWHQKAQQPSSSNRYS